MTPDGADLPGDEDVVITHVQERDGLDVYRITKGQTVIGEYTGRSISSTVFHIAVEHAESGRAVWLKDDLRVRRLSPPSPDEFRIPPPSTGS